VVFAPAAVALVWAHGFQGSFIQLRQFRIRGNSSSRRALFLLPVPEDLSRLERQFTVSSIDGAVVRLQGRVSLAHPEVFPNLGL